MRQKVVTIFLTSWLTKHLHTEELLESYLSVGWRVVSTSLAGGGADNQGIGAWAVFVLENSDPAATA
jgi:hypothetical protein